MIKTAPFPSVAGRKAVVIVVRRSTVVRMGVAAGVAAALAIGFGIGWAISSPPSATSSIRVVTEAATTPTSSLSGMATAAAPTTSATLPRTAACRPSSIAAVRPTSIDIGCHGDTTMSAVTWSSWGPRTAMGSGTLTVSSCRPSCATGGVVRSPAFVVLSHPLGGIFQDVLITPPSGSSTAQSDVHPGSGWGSG
jgi:hypothetical protein